MSRVRSSLVEQWVESLEDRLLFARPLGIDVSSFQGNVNWGSAYGGGVRFAYVKATEGSGYTNPYFSSQINGATDNSVVAGAYDFADFNTVSATTEASHFLAVAGNYVREGYLRPALDMEGSTSMSKTQVSNYVKSWASYVYSHTSVRAVVYASQSFAATYFDSTVPSIPSQLWEAHYNGANLYTGSPGSTTPYSTWTFWQVSSTGSVPGVSGNVDLDTYNGDINGLISDSGAVSSAGAKFNNGDRITVNSAQKAWNTYASDGTYVSEPAGKQGTVQASTPVFIRGYERVPVKFDGETAIRWVADNLESKVGGAAAMTSTQPATTTFASSTSASQNVGILGSAKDDVLA
jgi:GH25 family lysozyme M1 (1,4-beta-N-acetylmuramidase)